MDKFFHGVINEWASKGAEGEQRAEAAKIIYDFVDSKFTALYLCGLNLTSLPDFVDLDNKLHRLQHLFVNNNRLSRLPHWVYNASGLLTIYAPDNNISDIQSIHNLQKLSRLELHNNILTTLPAEIVQLADLEILTLSNNPIISLPYELKDWAQEWEDLINVSIQDKVHEPLALDMINNPPHYTQHPSGIECIEVTEHMGFNLGNAVKYIWRADLKGDALKDLQKAKWYIERELLKRSTGNGNDA
jgi:hypothetical protein